MDKKIYFASDVHLGLPPKANARQREHRFVAWLDSIKYDAEAVFLLGDIFDFWFEYKLVVPRGFVRTLGKIAELTDSGIPVHFFIGNHDLWVADYLPAETGVQLHTGSYVVELHGQRFFLAHGDALDCNDTKHQRLRRMFTNPWLRIMFASLHPRLAVGFAQAWSQQSRKQKAVSVPFQGAAEGLYQFALRQTQQQPIDYFIFGHRHTPICVPLEGTGSTLTILGEWISGGDQYAVFDDHSLELKK